MSSSIIIKDVMINIIFYSKEGEHHFLFVLHCKLKIVGYRAYAYLSMSNELLTCNNF